ncbi:hydantoinase/oxoprolinase family protein [Nocardia sp. NPDC050408]|uniref:hydantoinase/oxoprolinase family protein n=1 Tax=Nocardia sp. NPDC050408 TaxID=3364319 RepID=UPI0037ADA2C9
MRQVCIDVGGTFTDCVVQDENNRLHIFKSSTTPDNPVTGVLNVLAKAAGGFQESPPAFLKSLGLLVHGTTLATNVLLTGRGARAGFITTEGFREVLPMRRGIKHRNRSMFDQFQDPYRPLIDRSRILGVTERMSYTGEVRTALDESAVADAAERLVADGCTSIAIGFLHSYANPVHEARAREIVAEKYPDIHVVTSSDVLPAWREFERFSTTAVSAYIGPTVQQYLRELEETLRDQGLAAPLLIMLASGLMQTIDECADKGVHLITSGPAAAPFAALAVAEEHDQGDVLEVDMGGTSFDLCLIRDRKVPTTTESWVGDERVAIKIVDVETIGAGGGSIIWVDALGLIRVGPSSAGADPGPAAYGRSDLPTVTDADLVLGYLDPDYFLGGDMSLDRTRSTDALAKVGTHLGLDATSTAAAAFETATAVMADAVTEICTRRGHDVRSLTLVAGGGAGGLHSAPIAERLGIPTVIFPQMSAALSAFGMMTMDPGQELTRSNASLGGQVDVDHARDVFTELETEAAANFRRSGLAVGSMSTVRTVDLRYQGQFHELSIEVMDEDLQAGDFATVIERLHQTHERLYGYALRWRTVELLAYNLRATVVRPFPLKLATEADVDTTSDVALRPARRAFIDGAMTEIRAYDGLKLAPGHVIVGPALVDSTTTTVLVPRTFTCRVDAQRNLLLEAQS